MGGGDEFRRGVGIVLAPVHQIEKCGVGGGERQIGPGESGQPVAEGVPGLFGLLSSVAVRR
jgi:hypothetical protein